MRRHPPAAALALGLCLLLPMAGAPARAAVTLDDDVPAPPAPPARRPAPRPPAEAAPRLPADTGPRPPADTVPRPPADAAPRSPLPGETPRGASRASSQRAPAAAPATEEAPAEPPARGLVADARSRCSVWAPDLRPNETVEWTGACRNGMASGQGELLRRIGPDVVSLTQGRFADGKVEGPATIALAGGAYLTADFTAGQASTGTIRYGDASTYTGALRNTLPHGRGTRTWPRGPDYDGNWVNGQRSGEGRQQDGFGVYSGQWRNDKRNGQGTQIYLGGDRYEGEWRDDQRSGRGTMHWSGGLYEGEWRNDKRNGEGSETYRTGSRYIGQFADDLPSGYGTMIPPGAKPQEGRVVGGCFITEGRTYRVLPGPGPC